MIKPLPFNKSKIEEIIKDHPTPFHIYDEEGIREIARKLTDAYKWSDGFKNYFAVKATPNPYILEILRDEGMGLDCSSLPELLLAEAVGIRGEDIMFTSNDTPAEEYKKARELGAVINLDDISHIEFLEKCTGLPEIICFRYNPGASRTGNFIVGDPKEAKYGFTKEQLLEGYQILKERGVKRFGLHTMIASNELDPEYFIETARMIFDLVVEISRRIGIRFEFVNLGGGIGVDYKPEEKPVDINYVSKKTKELYEEKIVANGLDPLKIVMENGRFITGPNGFLVSSVLHKKDTYKKYIGLDASMANLMRPALYGAYHHITVLGKEDIVPKYMYDVTGSLCENNDKFAIDRKLPEVEIGDIVVIHGAGAHGHAMGFNYNGKLRSAELLLKTDGTVEEIRRAETVADYFSTLDFSRLNSKKGVLK